MRRFKIISLAIILLVAFASTTTVHGQNQGATVTIRLRHINGAPVVGEQVRLLRPPENEPILPDCTTDVNGECSWFVGRGLYALDFEGLSLDQLVSLAAAEGGLTGLGITVGEEDITYGFVIANGNKVYNDLAPESPEPEPFIPELEDLIHHETDSHEHEENILPPSETTPDAELTPALPVPPSKFTPTSVPVALTNSGDDPGESSTSGQSRWWPRIRFFLILGGGLVLGGAAFAWQQQRQKREDAANAKVTALPTVVIEAETAADGLNQE